MKNLKHRLIKNRHTSKGVFILFAFLCIMTGLFSFQYYNQLQVTIRAESSGYLEEISHQISNNINRIINDNYSVLNTLYATMKDIDADSFSDIKPLVDSQQSYWNFEDILLVDENGKAFNVSGEEILVSDSASFFNDVLNKSHSISTAQLINNQERIVLAIPLENLKINGKTMITMAASYHPSTFEQTLKMSAFNGEAFSCIIAKDGTTIIRPPAKASLKAGYNVLTTIEKSNLDQNITMDQVKYDIMTNQNGQIGFTAEDVRHYMVYTPINPDEWVLLTFVPAKVVNEKSDMLLRITLLLCGLITMVFAGLIAFLLILSLRNKRKLEEIAFVDDVTGGNTIQHFYILAKSALDIPNHPPYALVYTNLAKFKVLNEQFGRKTCDDILYAFHKVINRSLRPNEFVGRLSADNFCVLLEYETEEILIKRFEAWFNHAEYYVKLNKPVWSLPVTEFGVFIIDNITLPFPQMIDRAKLALRESSHMVNSKLRFAIYNDEVRKRLFREKQLEDMMERSLRTGEFHVYLQPKYHLPDQTIGGAEALSRWISPTEGNIYPDEFIPLFEKNGFVEKLDLWVFEEVCKRIRTWIDHDLEPIKVSVNCSRVHLKNLDFLNNYIEISQKYQIPKDLIEIELTESIVMEDSQRLSGIINNIHDAGFGCSMDDFGSGYSSLNLIQSIRVDTLKLDKIFFQQLTGSASRMESVVSSIINMAKALDMITVAEGIEYEEQVEMLQKIGCDYIQGYVFARPMPISEFEKLAFDDKT